MLDLVDSFFDRQLAFLWEQTVPHYWLTCFSIPMRMSSWINSLRRVKEILLESSKLSYRLLMTLFSFNNKKFKEFIFKIYPKNLTISETTEFTSVASYLDLLFTRDENNNIITKPYDKRDVLVSTLLTFPLCQAIFHQHQLTVSMNLSSFVVPIVV